MYVCIVDKNYPEKDQETSQFLSPTGEGRGEVSIFLALTPQ